MRANSPERSTMYRSKTLMMVLFVAAIALAGCTTQSPAAGTSDHVDGSDSDMDHVDMVELEFQPETLTVAVGSTVTWENHDQVQHTVTPVDKSQWGTEGSGDDGDDWMDPGDTWAWTFTEPGTYDYYCIPHAYQDDDGTWKGMTGTIVVEQGA